MKDTPKFPEKLEKNWKEAQGKTPTALWRTDS